ncbi:MAG TPA: contact-dependent growth inhibition system immunity protein [Lentibacillus sp.]|uniref:contact-dependent growth inhibition system immunity protein n=1 Tax=Lentibacillus sp. TaxID=1925746 RepID=UPI002B4AD479|nr:contact-dependent growth inhibition system immunity protein [Lentibacillus sp.]HLR63258.1 contact-dependent growth inhibition system immunity protein [Lentibacillus sp.]
MLSSNKQEEPIFQFLAGTFHQDIESPEQALQELLIDESKEYLEHAITFLSDFMKSNHSVSEKNEYIQCCADGIYFPDLGLEPLQWLNQVVQQITETAKSK